MASSTEMRFVVDYFSLPEVFMKHKEATFGKIRSYVWPISRHELRKFLPMLIMQICVCFNYSILRNLKDALIVTAEASGAEVIPFIKVWVILPAAIITTIIFTYLSNHFSRRAVFYIILSSFLIYFATFAFVIYPMRDAAGSNCVADFLAQILPEGARGLVSMFRNWSLTCFYVVSELWGSIVLTVLFWGFINEITRLSEATRFYSVLSIGSNTAAIIAGQIAVAFSQESTTAGFFGGDAWEQTLCKLVSVVICSGIAICITFHWMTKNVLNNPEFLPADEAESIGSKKKKKKLSFMESLHYLAHSKYLLSIAAMVISYNLVINLVEVIWKNQVRDLYPNPQQYNIYMNNLTSAMGVISTTASLLMVGIIRKLGWTKTALLTPLIMLATTVAFFGCILTKDLLTPLSLALFGTTPIAMAVFFGTAQNCFSKAAKYSLFDTTKEMAFIPLSSDLKLKGKAAIDGIGSRLGKSGSSFLHQGLLLIFSTLSGSTPYVAIVAVIVISIWIIAVRSLGHKFHAIGLATPHAHPKKEDSESTAT